MLGEVGYAQLKLQLVLQAMEACKVVMVQCKLHPDSVILFTSVMDYVSAAGAALLSLCCWFHCAAVALTTADATCC